MRRNPSMEQIQTTISNMVVCIAPFRGAAGQSAPGGGSIGVASHDQPGSASEESRSQELEEAAALFAMPGADGSQDGDPLVTPTSSSKRLVPETMHATTGVLCV